MRLGHQDVHQLITTRSGTSAREEAVDDLRRAAGTSRVLVDPEVFELAKDDDHAFGALLHLVAPQSTSETASLVAFRTQKPDPAVGRFYVEMDTIWTVSAAVDGRYLVTPEQDSGHEAWLATREQLDGYLGESRFIRDAEGTVWRIEGERGGLTDIASAGGKHAALPTKKLGLFDAA